MRLLRLPIGLVLISLLLPACFGAFAQPPHPPVPERTKAQWIAALKESDDANNTPPEELAPLLARSPDFVADVVHDAWPQLQNSTLRAMLVNMITEAAETPTGSLFPAPDEVLNTHVLEILALGLKDMDANVQENARDNLEKFAGQKFTLKSARDWMQQNGKHVPAEVVREGIRTLAASLVTAEPGMKMAILDRLREMRFAPQNAAPKTPDSKEVHAGGYAAVRRRAALDAGLMDTLAKLLHDGAGSPLPEGPNAKPDTPSILRRKALALVAAFPPDTSDLQRIEEDVKERVRGARREYGRAAKCPDYAAAALQR